MPVKEEEEEEEEEEEDLTVAFAIVARILRFFLSTYKILTNNQSGTASQ